MVKGSRAAWEDEKNMGRINLLNFVTGVQYDNEEGLARNDTVPFCGCVLQRGHF